MLNISLKAENIFSIGNFTVTNAVLLAFMVLILLSVLAVILKSKLKMVPGMFQNVAELVLEGALGLMDSVLGNRKTSEKYLPLVLTIFLFVLFSNWFGLVPGVGSSPSAMARPPYPCSGLLRATSTLPSRSRSSPSR